MGSDRLLWIEISNEHPRFVYRAGGQLPIGWPFIHKLRNIKFSAETLVDESGSLGEPQGLAFGASPAAARMVTMARKRCHVF
jgi:hypothetical protein